MSDLITKPPSELEVAEMLSAVRGVAKEKGLNVLRRLAMHRNNLETKNAELEKALGVISDLTWGGGWTRLDDVIGRVKQRVEQAKQARRMAKTHADHLGEDLAAKDVTIT